MYKNIEIFEKQKELTIKESKLLSAIKTLNFYNGRPLTEKIEHIKSFLAKSHISYRQSIVKLYLQTEKGKKSALELLSSKQIHYYQVREELKNI